MSQTDNKPEIATQSFVNVLSTALGAGASNAEYPQAPLTAKPFLVMVNPGMPLVAKEWAGAYSPANPTGDLAKNQNFAKLVNKLPTLSSVFNTQGGDLEEVYGQILKSDPPVYNPPPELQKEYDAARGFLFVQGTVDYDNDGKPVIGDLESPVYSAYKNRLSAYNDALSAYILLEQQYKDDPDTWSQISKIKKSPVDVAYNDLVSFGAKTKVEYYLGVMAQFGASAIATTLSQKNRDFQQTLRSLNGVNWHLTYPSQGNWFKPSDRDYTSYSFDLSKDFTSTTTSETKVGASVGFSFGLWRIGGGGGGSTSTSNTHFDATKSKITMDLCRIGVTRNWFDPLVLSIPGLKNQMYGVGAVSSGERDGNQNKGVAPLIVQSLLVARNVSVSASFTTQDIETVKKTMNAKASIGWGPFSIGGGGGSSSSSEKIANQMSQGTLTFADPQIIGFLCSVTPKCLTDAAPPASGSAAGAAIPAALTAKHVTGNIGQMHSLILNSGHGSCD